MDFVVAALVTTAVSVLSWRISVVTQSPLTLCALFAAPIIVATRSVLASLASLLAVTAVAMALLPANRSWDDLAFIFSGLCLIGSAMYAGLIGGTKLADARNAVSSMRQTQQFLTTALDAGGLCFFVLSKHLVWRNVSATAWVAFGCDPRLFQASGRRPDLDDEAVAALMHSSSRDVWRRLLESVKAEMSTTAPAPGALVKLRQRDVTLFDHDGTPSRYRFSISRSERGDLVFVGAPIAQATSMTNEEAWAQGLVQSTEGPALAVMPDGSVVAASPEFTVLVGPLEPGIRIFDVSAITGLDESTFATSVWSNTRNSPVFFNFIRLNGAGPATGVRMAPSFAPHIEFLLLSFQPMGLPGRPEPTAKA